MSKFWRMVKKELKTQKYGIIGAAGAVGGFIYNIFRPTSFKLTQQAVIGSGTSVLVISLGAIAVLVFIISMLAIITKSFKEG